MNDSNEKPSFLARFSIVATIVTFILQYSMAFVTGSHAPALITIIYPSFSYALIAGIYYLFKGKPTGADSVIADRLGQAWVASLVGGFVMFMLLK
jgi:hypothetical protein